MVLGRTKRCHLADHCHGTRHHHDTTRSKCADTDSPKQGSAANAALISPLGVLFRKRTVGLG